MDCRLTTFCGEKQLTLQPKIATILKKSITFTTKIAQALTRWLHTKSLQIDKAGKLKRWIDQSWRDFRRMNFRGKVLKKRQMTRKQQLEQELAEIKRQEQEIKENAEKQKLLDSGFYKPLCYGMVVRNLWYISEYSFREMADGFYDIGVLGTPEFKKGAKVVFIDCQGEKKWFNEQPDNNYFYIEDHEYGLPESEAEGWISEMDNPKTT